mmetsp:Transcript_9839/g.17881  ORF Transcript_9839/g.17881 Transcript_9839/m.17881 type:complete len:374 (+) Transcript_9839:1062-2183(+)
MLQHHLGPNNHPIGNIHQQIQHHIHGQKTLRQYYPANGAIVQGPFEPLVGMRIRRARGQAHDVPAQRTAPLRPHGIALVRHGRTPDLVLGERLLHLLQVGEQSDVAAHLVRTLGDAAQEAQDVVVDLARVRLAAHGDGRFESHLVAHHLVESLHLVVIAVEEFEEGGLRPRRALDAAHWEVVELVRDAFVIQQQVLHPERASLAHRGELRRLVVREAQCGHVLVLVGEDLEDRKGLHELLLDELERLLELHDVGVISHVTAGRSEVNDGHGLGRHVPVRVYVSHDVVAEFGFVLASLVEVDVVEIVLHLLELFVGDFDAELLFGGGEGEPELAPSGEFHGGGEDGGHFLGGIAVFCFFGKCAFDVVCVCIWRV